MAKVTVTEYAGDSDSKAVADGLIHVKDAKGRTLGLRKLPFLEEFRIIEAVGPELSSNTTYMAMLNPLLYLAEIDGIAVDIPRNKRNVEALIQRAGRDGFMAVVDGIKEHFAEDQEALEQKIKNSDGTPASETVSGS